MDDFRTRMLAGEMLAGTFVKTPAIEMVEVLALSGLDFACLDAEHAPFDRGRIDACLALGRALGFPLLVRVAEATPPALMQALDAGAAGVVVPHVDSAAAAARIAKACRYGHGGRGFAGSTRSAGYGTRSMGDVLSDGPKPLVIAQIEDPEGVDACEGIAATPGVDGIFLGPADLSVSHGKMDQTSPELMAAIDRVGAACAASGKPYMTFTPDVEKAAAWRAHGFSVFFVASEHAWMLQGARAVAKGIKALG
ncbi:aldolase/citrate lyase family protein [Dinoroseobacter sp. PD6]|uniref:HpcH/HpaI aldolase family protein n=1 Tax=Dinoroseobacter sp. PD6 TaxID=3028384 RepID=UPI00237B803B|nr:aldolase/citrate lyase family protein [Dinoroseobacter sp. PD6]MDD9717717.1 aldolase/citrate lyase family protein [Dinoroseobacter sp. PD6]